MPIQKQKPPVQYGQGDEITESELGSAPDASEALANADKALSLADKLKDAVAERQGQKVKDRKRVCLEYCCGTCAKWGYE